MDEISNEGYILSSFDSFYAEIEQQFLILKFEVKYKYATISYATSQDCITQINTPHTWEYIQQNPSFNLIRSVANFLWQRFTRGGVGIIVNAFIAANTDFFKLYIIAVKWDMKL